ncbi:DUF4123 domain-containing protein [Aeromonas piscicola]|uniref:DUF4123 domain-containing protein n=1 Tax=Aeromonas piscicola TaxID=600645 RepID=UPI0021F8D2E0|nr:DUF4123 domain-containing protein [Aeromonas piscicola]MCW0504535.1 DUF4123 domain-containing protein [Aeromonas piscicola]
MLPDKLWSNDACYVLFEGAELKGELRETLLANEGGALRPLLIHPDVFELINLGPWLWHCQPSSAYLLEQMIAQGLVQGLIHSQRSLDELQQQFAMGCMVVEPKERHSQLLRFYTSSALPVMLAQRDLPWYASLFGGLTDWWCYHCDGQWIHHSINVELAELQVIILTNELQAALLGDPEAPRLLAMWQGSVRFQQFPACIRTNMALKALKKADDAGAPSSARLIWGLAWLEGGNPALTALKNTFQERM